MRYCIPFLFLLTMAAAGCKHEPLEPFVDIDVPDTSSTCDPDTVYFQNDVLPIFATSCAVPGCHDAGTAQDGILLNNYANIMSTGDVDAENPGNSDVYEMITENDDDKRMPPISSGITLTQDQINTIYEWIAQGAANNICVQVAPCDTADVSFSADIWPTIENSCLSGCHGPGGSGNGIFTDHASVLAKVNNGSLMLRVVEQGTMPPSGGLTDCQVDRIEAWILNGAPNN